MSNTEAFNGYYLGSWDPQSNRFSPLASYAPGLTTLSDSQDGTADGSVAIGGMIDVSGVSSTLIAVVSQADGGGVIVEDSGMYYWVTNDANAELTNPTGSPSSPYTFCFLSGTHIATPTGEVLVEELNIGDIVSTANGGTRKIVWIGQQKVATFFASSKNCPIEFCISALDENLPKRPLRVSPGHSLLVDGAFPIASAMVNGTTVRQMTKSELPEVFTYYHVEVEDHALILAEGVPAETFLDASSRRTFDNWQEYVHLYGDEERNVPPSELHFNRILKFEDLPEGLKDTLGEPLKLAGMNAA